MLMDIEFNRERFNCLSAIELADAEIRRDNSLDDALKVFGPIFSRHGMCEHWGLGLLHRHWSVAAHEIPVQRITKPGTPREHTLSPRKERLNSPLWPSVLAVNLDRPSLLALEYSTDPATRTANDLLMDRPDFCREFIASATARGWRERFGLSALRPVTDGYEVVEFNYIGRASVTREVLPSAVSKETLIETVWQFDPTIYFGSCTKSCWARCTSSGSGSHSKDHPAAHKPGFTE